MKITVDRTKCDGYGKCVQALPKEFKLDAKMIAEVIDPKADTDETDIACRQNLPNQSDRSGRAGHGKKLFPLA